MSPVEWVFLGFLGGMLFSEKDEKVQVTTTGEGATVVNNGSGGITTGPNVVIKISFLSWLSNAVSVAAETGSSYKKPILIGTGLTTLGLYGARLYNSSIRGKLLDGGNTLLHQAVTNGDLGAIKDLLNVGNGTLNYCRSIICPTLDVNARNDKQETPLHCAIRAKKVESVKALLEAGADIYAADADEQVCLELAGVSGSPSIKTLVEGHVRPALAIH